MDGRFPNSRSHSVGPLELGDSSVGRSSPLGSFSNCPTVWAGWTGPARERQGWAMERRAQQMAIMVAGCVPVFAGLAGAILGAAAFGAWPGRGADSHVRYL